MSQSIQDQAWGLIGQRSVWEQRQRLWYIMAHDGTRRMNKPWATAADGHFPLIDMQIGQLKPFWISQALGGDRLTDFVALDQSLSDTAESAADYLNWDLRHGSDSDFEERLEQAIYYMLLRGRSGLKVVWDPYKQKKRFAPIDTMNILIDRAFEDFHSADWFIEIQTMTVGQYKRNRAFEQDDTTIAALTDKANWVNAGARLDKEVREGVTHSTNPNEIVIWNLYKQTQSGWIIDPRSPLRWNDVKIRDPYYVPVEWQGETLLPFNSFTMERKDIGWFASRGIAELSAAFEAYLTMLWNNRADAIKFATTPIFTSDGEIQNVDNLKFMPGEYVPGGLRGVQMPPVSETFPEEMNFTRSVAEQRSRVPDMGQFAPEETGNKPITATQSRISAGLAQVGADHDGRSFRNQLARVYRLCWALNVQYKPSQTTYFIGNDLKELPPQALHDQFFIVPAGSGGTKDSKQRESDGLYMMFKGAPNIEQDELAKNCIAARDSRLVKKLLIPTNQKQGSEAFQEDTELLVLREGRPVPVLPGQDHATRLMECAGFLHACDVKGEPLDPQGRQTIVQHMQEHAMWLKKTQPQAFQQVMQAVQQMEGHAQVVQRGRLALTNGTQAGQQPAAAPRQPIEAQPV